jgi:hypothetical protein
MPLLKGKKNISRNIKELTGGKAGKTREKGIQTMMSRYGISHKEAKVKQAVAIAIAKSKK